VRQNHLAWKDGHPINDRKRPRNISTHADRADWFCYDVVAHIGGEEAAKRVKELMVSRTDAAKPPQRATS
jgi:hypothetical protein